MCYMKVDPVSTPPCNKLYFLIKKGIEKSSMIWILSPRAIQHGMIAAKDFSEKIQQAAVF